MPGSRPRSPTHGDHPTPPRHPRHRGVCARSGGHHHAPGRPRGRGDQGGAAPGRLHPRDDMAHRRGGLAHASPHQPGEAEPGAGPASRGRGGRLPRVGGRGRRGGRGDATRGTGPPGARLRRSGGGEPQAGVLHHLGLRDDRALQGLPEPRDRLRHLGRDRQPGHRRGGVRLHPRARVDRDPRRPAVRGARDPGRGHPGPRDGQGLVPRDRPIRRGSGHGLVPQRELAGLRATRVRGHRQQGGRLRAPGAGHRRDARRGPLPGLRNLRRPPRAVHGL